MSEQWTISSEERAKHDALFLQQSPAGGYLSGDQAKRFFLQSGLPMSTLGQIWNLADVTADGRVDRREFSIAMYLIKRCLQGADLPNVLPASLKVDPPVLHQTVPLSLSGGMFGSFGGATLPLMMRPPTTMFGGGLSLSQAPAAFNSPAPTAFNFVSPAKLPQTSVGLTEWAIPLVHRLKYSQIFNNNDATHKNFLTGQEAKSVLSMTGLNQQTLAQIWMLSDVDGNGNLTVDEFCVAMHLVDMVKSGQLLPSALPLDLVPPAYRNSIKGPAALTGLSPALSKSMTLPKDSVLTPVKSPDVTNLMSSVNMDNKASYSRDIIETNKSVALSFEDKRKENFEKGQAELERRRAMLLEQQKREAEDRLAFEKREQDKRERARVEQEQRKQQELEKHLEKQRKQEQEIEEQRRKAMEQREAARRELERQRQLEWERQRRDQLTSEKHREQTSVDKLKLEVGHFREELCMLDNKRQELSEKLEKARQCVVTYTSSIETMRTKRDSTMSDIEHCQLGLDDWHRKLSSAELEKSELSRHVQGLAVPVQDEAYQSLCTSCTSKRAAVRQLKSQMEQLETQKQKSSERLETHQQQLVKLKNSVNMLEQENSRLEIMNQRRNNEPTNNKINGLVNGSDHCTNHDNGNGIEVSCASSLPSRHSPFTVSTPPASAATANTPASVNTAISALASISGSVAAAAKAPASGSASVTAAPASTVSAIVPASDAVPAPATSAPWCAPAVSKPASTAIDWTRKSVTLRTDSTQPCDVRWSSPSNHLTEVVEAGSSTAVNSSSSKAVTGLIQYVALYQFDAELPSEMSLSIGDIVWVDAELIGTQPGWLSGKKGVSHGWFPESFVERVTAGAHQDVVDPQLDFTPVAAAAVYDGFVDPHSANIQPVDVNSQEIYGNFSELAAAEQVALNNVSSARNGSSCDVSTGGEQYVALYDFVASEPGDLTLNAGDVITVHSTDGDWWTGSINSQTGVFPSNFVKPLHGKHSHRNADGKSKPEVAQVILDYAATGPEQLTLQVGQLIHVHRKSHTGWWEGQLQAKGRKKRVGWFPANYVKLLGQSDDQVVPGSSSITAQQSFEAVYESIDLSASRRTPVAVEQVVAQYTYQAQQEDELSFSKGDVITVLSKDDSSWWQGEVRGQVGLFPSNYIVPCSEPEDPQHSTRAPTTVHRSSSRTALSDMERKRQNYIQELITTEETFTKDLATVLDVFYKPFMTEKLLTEEELNILFINWKELRVCNMKLMKALRVRQKMCGHGRPILMIGDLLCENFPHMSPYIRFCSCQLNSAALLQKKTETDSKFKEAHKKYCQNARTMGMPLSSFLLKPMQRITRYPLLIDKILQHTPADHPDHHNMQEALAKATELCSQVNEGVREKENSDRLEWLQNHVHCDGLPEKLTFNSSTNCLGPRKYIHSGTLYKVKSGKELVGFLFNDFLLLTQPQRPLGSTASNFRFDLKGSSQFKMYRNPIFLNDVMLRKLPDDDPDGCIFHLCHVDHVYSLRTSSSVERETWVRKIDLASKQYLETESKKREKAHHARLPSSGSVGRLMVVVVSGIDLKASDDNGKSDPYCEISMGTQEHKTKVIPNTLNPKWNSSMQFNIRDLQEDVLCITVYDRDLFTPNDFLGRTEIRIKDILAEMRKAKGTITKRLLLHEVETGEVVVKLNLQLFEHR